MTVLFQDLEQHGHRIAVIAEEERLTYTALLARADAIAAPVSPREVVLVACCNTLSCLAGYIGFLRAGAVPILVHHSMSPEQGADIVARFQPRYLYAPQEGGSYSLVERERERSTSLAPHADLALLLPTSGTTGSRNFVRLSARNVESNARSIIAALDITADDRVITTMPMSYTYGLSVIHTHLLTGASIVLTERPVVSPDFWRMMRDEAVTTLNGVPFIYDMLRKLRFGAMDLPHLRKMTQAGGKLGPELTALFNEIAERKAITFTVMYGQTEATARIAVLSWTDARQKVGSIGKPVEGVDLSLVDDGGMPIREAAQAGELVCRGDNVSMGYASLADDLGRPDDNGGVLRTGDIAERDHDGFYFIVGRRKRFVKIFGHRVSLDEMEALLRRDHYDCACAGMDDHLQIFVAGASDRDGVVADVCRLTGLHHRGFEVTLVSAIPRSESGKVDYARLEAFAA